MPTVDTVIAGLTIHCITVEELVHVGTLYEGDAREQSYEGQGMSVSNEPDAWVAIARLGGVPWNYSIQPGRFVDFYALTEAQLNYIHEDLIRRGWIAPATLFQLSWWDDEYDSPMHFTFQSRQEAEDEGMEDSTIAEHPGFRYTNSFPDNTVQSGETASDDIMVAAWVNASMPDIDGVWWAETLDVSRLSAPRGVISVNRVQWWKKQFKTMEDAA